MLRQTLICHADISPVLWTWDDQDNKPAPLIYNDHTCRDFDRVREWAWSNRLRKGWQGDSGGVSPGDSGDLIMA
jgi:hypothetical protein